VLSKTISLSLGQFDVLLEVFGKQLVDVVHLVSLGIPLAGPPGVLAEQSKANSSCPLDGQVETNYVGGAWTVKWFVPNRKAV
jgi:hypothetical protein